MLWVDDSYMGTALLVDHAELTGDPSHLAAAASNVASIFGYLSAADGDGLLRHG